jgi:mRNA-degrading endonuclease RelE of RelBE toxin-antitoxin system
VKYRVKLTDRAKKDLKRLSKPDLKDTLDEILELEKDPEKGHTLSGCLKGVRSLVYSLPGGAYRAAYYVLTEDRICLVFMVGPHEGFYEKATRRAEALIRLGRVK